jgi:hypothetical protein
MKTEKRHLTVAAGSLLGAAVLSGVAIAGNPHGTPPGQAKAQAKAQVKAQTKGSASASPSTAAGVKASAVTNSQKNTNAAAASNRTKLYGNGKTAGQIAMQNGASGSANLYGPGNSQPHKPVCPGAKPTFDVHALKAHGGAACPTSSTSTSTSTSSSTSTSTSAHASGNVAGAAASHSGTKASNSSAGGVLGAQHNGPGSVNGTASPASPVFGAANFTG